MKPNNPKKKKKQRGKPRRRKQNSKRDLDIGRVTDKIISQYCNKFVRTHGQLFPMPAAFRKETEFWCSTKLATRVITMKCALKLVSGKNFKQLILCNSHNKSSVSEIDKPVFGWTVPTLQNHQHPRTLGYETNCSAIPI